MIDVLLIEDNVRVRETVKQELEQHAKLRVVGEAADGIAGLHLALSLRPHVVVMDIGLSRLDGIEATRRIKTAVPDITIIGLSVHNDERMRRAMVDAGATRLVSKDAGLDSLTTAIIQAGPGIA